MKLDLNKVDPLLHDNPKSAHWDEKHCQNAK